MVFAHFQSTVNAFFLTFYKVVYKILYTKMNLKSSFFFRQLKEIVRS
jgi:hypothetical protein